MRHLRSLFGVAFLFSAATFARPARLDNLAERLASIADRLAAESYQGFRDRDQGNRADVEALYLIRQFSAGTTLFRSMVADRRPESELRDSMAILKEQLRSSQRYGFGQREWQEMSRIIEDISRELGGSRDRRDERDFHDDHRPDRVNGRLRWRGRVDNEVDLRIQGMSLTAKVVSGGSLQGASSEFTSALPPRAVDVEVRKLKGRGDVRVVQQPSRDNGYAAVVRIHDEKGGADEYELEIVW